MTDPAFLPAHRLATMIRQRKIGCLELLEHHLERLRRLNPGINAVIATRLPAARKAARAGDEQLRKRGFVPGPLFGVPMTVKESFDVQGMDTTWGLPEYAGRKQRRHALAVQRLLDAGANIYGKTNVPVLLADWQSFNPVYGATGNPWDPSRTPGGSSGGSAAALAAGLSALEYGSDIGASIRNPAHYCGVYGHKPTFGIVSSRGQALGGSVAASDIAAIGPLARSARDLEIALQATMGPDEIDGAGWQLALPKPAFRKLSELRVAVMTTTPTAEVDDAVQAKVLEVARHLAACGAKVSHRARPAIDEAQAHTTYVQLLRFATAGRQTSAQYKRFLKQKDRLRANDHSYLADLIRGTTMAPREWVALNEQRHQMRHAWAGFFRDWDVLLCPAAATVAFPRTEKGERWERMIDVNGRPQPSTTQMFWAGYSGMCLLPSTVAPAGLSRDGLPVGVQIIGAQHADLTTIRVAHLLEREFAGFVAPPDFR
ncbi:MAG: amidase [Burkholderiaceae bacterium]